MARIKQLGSLCKGCYHPHRGWGNIVHIRVDCKADLYRQTANAHIPERLGHEHSLMRASKATQDHRHTPQLITLAWRSAPYFWLTWKHERGLAWQTNSTPPSPEPPAKLLHLSTLATCTGHEYSDTQQATEWCRVGSPNDLSNQGRVGGGRGSQVSWVVSYH